MTKCMKKCYLDTNILIYLKNNDSPFHSESVNVIKYLTKKNYSLTISPLIIDEFLHQFRFLLINQKQKGSTIYSNLTKALKQVIALPNLKILNPPLTSQAQLKVIKLMQKFSLRPRDAYHLLTMKHHQVKYFATFDQDFNQVFFQKTLSLINAQTLHQS